MSELDKLIVIGDRVLVRPACERLTKSGLLLPANYQDKEEIQTGLVLKCGPGYAMPSNNDGEEWNSNRKEVHYMPLQVRQGDVAIYFQKHATEIKYNGEKYFIIPQSAILLVERDEF